MSEITKRILTTIPLSIIFFISIVYPSYWPFKILILTCFSLITFFEWPKFFSYKTLLFWISLFIYIFIPFYIAIVLHEYNYKLIIFLILAVAIHDSGSYFIGKLFGKHKILPLVSPKKTWEGFVGGYLSTLIFTSSVFASNASWIYTIFFTLIFCVIALFGDLFESALKRKVGIKDSGNILPGHGGLLDRFDAALFAIYLIYLFKDQISNILKY